MVNPILVAERCLAANFCKSESDICPLYFEDDCKEQIIRSLLYEIGTAKRRTDMTELKDTIEGMTSEDYKERFVAEYQQTKTRYEKLKDFCNRIEVAEIMGKDVPKHDCPLSILREQQKYMGMYLSILEKRAIIEGISI